MTEKEEQQEHRISDLEHKVRRLTKRLDRLDPSGRDDEPKAGEVW